MKRNVLTTLTLLMLYTSASAQLVIDQKAIAKSGENMAVNVIKQQHYKKIRDFTGEINGSYGAIAYLQQRVLNDLKEAESVSDLHWG